MSTHVDGLEKAARWERDTAQEALDGQQNARLERLEQQIRVMTVERDELASRIADAQQWLDSDPDWKAKFMASFNGEPLTAENQRLREENQVLRCQRERFKDQLGNLRASINGFLSAEGLPHARI